MPLIIRSIKPCAVPVAKLEIWRCVDCSESVKPASAIEAMPTKVGDLDQVNNSLK